MTPASSDHPRPPRKWLAVLTVTAVGMLLVTGCGSPTAKSAAGPEGKGTIVVTSSAFSDGGTVPLKYSCNGDNVSPPLTWRNVPAGTAELAVIVDDPDATDGVFYHWIVAGLSPTLAGLREGERPPGSVEATGSSGEAGYTGPCPPDKQTHHYRFTVYALRGPSGVTAALQPVAAKNKIVAVELAEGRLVAKFGR